MNENAASSSAAPAEQQVASHSAPLPYREVKVRATPPTRFFGLVPTTFRVAERSGSHDTLIIFPGFGVSVRQIGADELLWWRSARYGTLITHDAINYRTSVDFLLWQWTQLFRELDLRSINMLGMSLGGGTAVQLLYRLLRDDPELYGRTRRLVTLIAPILLRDFNSRWQGAIRLMGELCEGGMQRGEISRRIRHSALRVVARAIQPRIQSSCLEADSLDEIIYSFGHMVDSYRVKESDVPLRGLPNLEIVSVGTEDDNMVSEPRVHRYGVDPGRHIVVKGRHAPDFYDEAREYYDRILLTELG